MNRKEDFDSIKNATKQYSNFADEKSLVINADSLEVLKSFPDNCVSLILTDPPYHTTKKKNIYGDTAFKEDSGFLEWLNEYAKQWKRVLKPNGSLFCFCSSAMAARIEVMLSNQFNILSSIVWTKPNEPGFDGWKSKMNKQSLRQWYPHSERIVFAEPAFEGNLSKSYFSHFLKNVRKASGLTSYQLTHLSGAYGKVNHGGAVSNWETGRNIPSKEQYQKICHAILSTGKVSSMPEYEDIIRVFNVDSSKQFTDIWDYPSVKPYKGKHPAEKPSAMLEKIIDSTSSKGDIVLDCFSGSGSTCLAALKLDRLSISIEIESKYTKALIDKIR